MTTSPVPSGNRVFQIDFDFIAHRLEIRTADGAIEAFALAPQSVAAFYRRLFAALEKLGIAVAIHKKPNEVADPIPFDRDETHASYDAEYANRFWRALVQSDRVFKIFRARFLGKCSPVHFFWGAPDLAVTRFSGRVAPVHPGGIPNLPDEVTRDAYSHEVSSCGFWPGGGAVAEPAFYAYAYPSPAGFAEARVRPEAAFYSKDLGEFVLPVRRGEDGRVAGPGAPRVPPVDVRRRGRARPLGPEGARTEHRLERPLRGIRRECRPRTCDRLPGVETSRTETSCRRASPRSPIPTRS